MEPKSRHHHQQHQNSGILRYHSAPTSLLTNLVGNYGHGCVNEIEEASRGFDHHHHPQQQQQNRNVPSEMEAMLANLLSSSSFNNGSWTNVKQEETGESVFCNVNHDHLTFHSQQFTRFPNSSSSSSSSSRIMNMMRDNTMASENSIQSKMCYGNASNLLIRQKSSPPGFLSDFSLTNGFATLGEQATTSTSGFNSNPTFSSRRMPQIAENGSETLEEADEEEEEEEEGEGKEETTCVLNNRNLRNDNVVKFFTSDLWENSAFTVTKTARTDNNEFMFSLSDALESQHADVGYQNVGVSRQLSLPSSSTKMTSMGFLQIQGSVPCKIRAKRGFATHPRSIAERMRRTRISERIKKLQELFPKSDKQTSTADMLDLAVDYIKDLQKQVKILRDTRAKCICSRTEEQHSRPYA